MCQNGGRECERERGLCPPLRWGRMNNQRIGMDSLLVLGWALIKLDGDAREGRQKASRTADSKNVGGPGFLGPRTARGKQYLGTAAARGAGEASLTHQRMSVSYA